MDMNVARAAAEGHTISRCYARVIVSPPLPVILKTPQYEINATAISADSNIYSQIRQK